MGEMVRRTLHYHTITFTHARYYLMKLLYATRFYIHILALLLTALMPGAASAFSTDKYATESALANGKWIKVSVESTGMHFIPASTLRSWGFSNPEKVRIHGYGGARIADLLSASGYIDDLPPVASRASASGVYFYAVGPVTWRTVNSRYVHTLNPYSTKGYYFITEADDEAPSVRVEGLTSQPVNPVNSFTERIWHEEDIVSLGNTGLQLFGEDFRYSPSRSFKFTLAGRVDNTPVWMRTRFVVNAPSASTLSITANGSQLGTGSNTIGSTTGDNYGTAGTFDHTFTPEGTSLDVGMRFSAGGTVKAAHLDAISINYTRAIAIPASGSLEFEASRSSVVISGAGVGTTVWDVTDPQNIFALPLTEVSADTKGWVNSYSGSRRYTAWNDNSRLPAPAFVSSVENQNLHSTDNHPDMVIFTIADWAGEAERLANVHRFSADSLRVMVVNQELVFNEFASGSPDVNAFRKMLKMLYDRGESADGHRLRYALFMGRPTFDNRVLTSHMKALGQKYMPTWQTDESLRETGSYSTDDIFAFLEDNSGRDMSQDTYSIAVGRLPIHSTAEARTFVDKIIAYTDPSNIGSWQAQTLFQADDGDLAKHMDQTDTTIDSMRTRDAGKAMMVTRIYADAFEEKGGVIESGRDRLYRKLDEGVLWWNYLGHGDQLTIGHGKMVLYTDINNIRLRYQPFLAAYTCSFMQWDAAELSGGEILALNDRGIIGMLSASRKSFISNNGDLSPAVSAYMFDRDTSGRFLPIGEIVRRGKNRLSRISGRSDDNKLRFALLGDPALRLSAPSLFLKLETIDGETVDPDKQLTIKARQNVVMTGSVVDASGSKINSFNGPLLTTLYDAETSVTTLGRDRNDKDGKPHVYDEPGSMLYQGRDSVKAGEFTIRIAMPFETAENFRPATLQMYAYSTSGNMEASGLNSDFYVYGTDESAAPDTIPPTIDMAVLNHSSFLPGQTVNESPMFLADVSDNVGINLSMAGVGHQMTLRLDGRTTYSDLSLYYTPRSDGTPGGSIAYPLSGLADGDHSLTLRVWDTSGNSTSHNIPFRVSQGIAPTVFDIYTDANPASTQARFYLTHNRPDATLTVTFEVFNMLGRRVWSSTVTDRSDMFQSAPVTWDLSDMGGHRVTRGIYIYRAIVKTDSGDIYTAAKRIAVTG